MRIAFSSRWSDWPGSRPSSSTSLRAGVLVDDERVRLAAGTVEREHQEPAQPLAEGLIPDERLQLPYDLPRAAERQIGLEALFERDQAQLLEAADLVAGERLELEVGKRRAAPERKRIPGARGPRPPPPLRRAVASRVRAELRTAAHRERHSPSVSMYPVGRVSSTPSPSNLRRCDT